MKRKNRCLALLTLVSLLFGCAPKVPTSSVGTSSVGTSSAGTSSAGTSSANASSSVSAKTSSSVAPVTYHVTWTGLYQDGKGAEVQNVITEAVKGTLLSTLVPAHVNYEGEHESYVFVDWTIGTEHVEEADLDKFSVTGEMTIAANYKKTDLVKIQFMSWDAVSTEYRYYEKGTNLWNSVIAEDENLNALTVRAATAQYTYTFKGFSTTQDTADDGTPEVIEDGYALNADATFYAVFTHVENKYTITYSGDSIATKAIKVPLNYQFSPITLAIENGIKPNGTDSGPGADGGRKFFYSMMIGTRTFKPKNFATDTYTVTGDVAITVYTALHEYYNSTIFSNVTGGSIYAYGVKYSTASQVDYPFEVDMESNATIADELKVIEIRTPTGPLAQDYTFKDWVETNNKSLAVMPNATDGTGLKINAIYELDNLKMSDTFSRNTSAIDAYVPTDKKNTTQKTIFGFGDSDNFTSYTFADGKAQATTSKGRVLQKDFVDVASYIDPIAANRYSTANPTYHAFGIDTVGDVYAYGYGQNGCLGIGGSTFKADTPTEVKGLPTSDPAIEIATGRVATLVLTKSGKLYFAGNFNGTNYSQFNLLSDIATYSNFDSVTPAHVYADTFDQRLGARFLILDKNGSVWAFGMNGWYLGNSAAGFTSTLTELTFAQTGAVKDLRFAGDTVFAYMTDEKIITWGEDAFDKAVTGRTATDRNPSASFQIGYPTQYSYWGMTATPTSVAVLYSENYFFSYGTNDGHKFSSTDGPQVTAANVGYASKITVPDNVMMDDIKVCGLNGIEWLAYTADPATSLTHMSLYFTGTNSGLGYTDKSTPVEAITTAVYRQFNLAA
jgi:hypothetical protein